MPDGHGRDGIPVIDCTACEPSELDRICRELGFLQIVGHGVPDDVVDGAWTKATAFFDLPIEEKLTVAMPEPGYPYGYSPVAAERLASSLGNPSPPDLKETYVIGPGSTGDDVLSDDPTEAWVRSPSLFPAALPELRPAWEAYFDVMGSLAARLLGLMAAALDLPDDTFGPLIDRHPSALRALNYPHLDHPAAPGQLRAGAHTDYGTLTILRQDDAPGGLEVQGPDGRWLPVPSIPGAFVVNLGDSMQRWTNDRWRSTLHRVVVPDESTSLRRNTRRQSMAFFHNANWDAMIECLPTCLGPGEVPRHEPIRAGEWLMQKYHRTVLPEPGTSGATDS